MADKKPFTDEESNVIPIRKEEADAGPVDRFLIKSSSGERARSRVECLHHAAIVNKETRRVYCRSCDVDLDPIAVLHDVARNADWVVSLRKEREQLRRQVDDLRGEVTKLKAAKRRVTK